MNGILSYGKNPTHGEIGARPQGCPRDAGRPARQRTSAALVLLGLLALLLVPSCTQAPQVTPLTETQRGLNRQSFDYVWTTIRDKHWDPELGGLDWQAIYDELSPRLDRARTMEEARSVIEELTLRLGHSHVGIIPNQLYEDLDQPDKQVTRPGVTGLTIRVIEGHALVVAVRPDSPADSLGIRPGWEILAIGGEEVAPRIRRLSQRYAGKTSQDYMLGLAIRSRLYGEEGAALEVCFRDGQGRKVTHTLPLITPKGRKATFGHLPTNYVWFESQRLANGVGYVAFNFFLDVNHVMQAYNEVLASYLDAPGIVIDLRGNPGGLGAMAMGMAGWLIGEKGHPLGTMYLRESNFKFLVNPRPRTFAGPVAVLIDGLSGSTAEILAGGLKDLGRARTFGTTTAGAALPSNIERLPNGDGFQYTFANYISQGGETLEDRGVIPDVVVPHTRETLLQGRDLALETALAWIETAR